ncbi:MAG TPA: hypothetical protein VFO27_03715 [Bryobacteraceae bacterium]|nr:hypothetical protein [Bryobacteraceae bacterium]
MIPEIRALLQKEFPDQRIEAHYAITIVATGDITGDSVPEALVTLGDGGAYTDEVTLVRMEGHNPVAAVFRQKDTKVSCMVFVQGSSVRHGDTVEMKPERQAIYAGHWSTDDAGKVNGCYVEAYRWHAKTRTFNLNEMLSGEIGREFCRKVASNLEHVH